MGQANFRPAGPLIRRQRGAREGFLVQQIASSRPQPDEFYPKPPPTEPLPVTPKPPEAPQPTVPSSIPSSLPEQPLEPEKPVIHPMPQPEVP